jgi:hypothetical protein
LFNFFLCRFVQSRQLLFSRNRGTAPGSGKERNNMGSDPVISIGKILEFLLSL